MKWIILAVLAFANLAHAEPWAVKNPVPAVSYSMPRHEVAWLYTMKTRFWLDGTKITVFYLDRSSKVHKDFCKNVLGMEPSKFDSMLDMYLNSGNAGSFRLVKSQAEVEHKVSLVEGSIGYFDDKTIFINGGGHVAKITISD